MTRLDAMPRQAGFSLVELLVTIVLAGIVFAAMVPMFLLAQQTNAGDNMRTIALQVAQDKIEKIRQLDYDQIAADAANPTIEPNLYSSAFAGGQFGPSFAAVAGETTKTIHIDYTVTPMPEGSPAGMEQYKKVVVDAYWDAPPAPVKHVILQTFVYRQYAGPQITAFEVSPLEHVDDSIIYITDSQVDLEAVIASADIAAMNAGGTPTGFVRFTVNAVNGAQVAFAEVNTPMVGQPAVYEWSWDATLAPDGVYLFQAVAFSKSRMEGNGVGVAYRLERGAPSAPSGLQATVGNETALLTWAETPAGDLDHYELWRGTASGTETLLVGDLTTSSFNDTGLTNGVTYYYYVKAVDDLGNVSGPSSEVSATPTTQTDVVPPDVPSTFSVAKSGASQPSVLITWVTSLDYGTPTSGLRGYEIERSPDGTGDWVQIEPNSPATAISFLDATAGWDATWYYRMRAVDLAGNASAYTAVRSATTDPQPMYTLTVRNDHNSSTLYVRVQSVSTGLWYTTSGSSSTSPPSEVAINKKGKSKTWSNLPSGLYTVFGRYGTTTTSRLADLSGGPTTAVFP